MDLALLGYLFGEVELQLRILQLAAGVLLHPLQYLIWVRVELLYRIDIAGMEGKGDHRLYLVELDHDGRVIPGGGGRLEPLVSLRASVDMEIFLDPLIGAPDGGPAGRLRSHHVDAAAELHRQIRDSGADKFHNLVLYKTVFEDRADDRQRDVLRADSGTRGAGEIYGDDVGARKIIGAPDKLFHKLRATLADTHRPQSAVTRMAVRAEDHPSAAGHHLPYIGMDDRQMRGDKLSAVPLRGREAEKMIVLVDRPADGAERIMAVGHDIGDREALHAAGDRGLDDTHIGDVMRGEAVKAYTVIILRAGDVMRHDNIGRDRPSGGALPVLRQPFQRLYPRGLNLLVDCG